MTSPNLGSVEVDVELNVADIEPRLRRALRRPAERAGEDFEDSFGQSGDRAGRKWADRFRVGMRGRMRAVQAEVGVSVDESSLAQAREQVERATRVESLLSVDADVRKAQREIAELVQQRGTARLDIDADISRVQKKLAELEGQRGTSIEVDADIRKYEARLRSLRAQRETAEIDVDADIRRAQNRIQGLTARGNLLRLQVDADARGVRDVERDLSALTTVARNAGSALTSVVTTGAKLTLVGAGAGAAVAGVTSLTGGVVALGAALGQAAGAAGLLPAALLGVQSVVGTIKLGTQGLEDALGAVAEGDAKALNEAMKELAPSAQAFVRAVAGAKPAFDRMQLGVQQRLFDGLANSVSRLAARYLPVANRLFGATADNLNAAAKEALRFANDSEVLGQTKNLVENLIDSTHNLVPAVKPALSAFLDISEVGSKFLPDMAAGVSRLSERFADFIRNAAATGELDKFFTASLDTLRELGVTVRDFAVGLGNVFKIANQQGGGLLNTLQGVAEQFRAWTESAQGQKSLMSFFDAMQRITAALLPVVGELVQALGAIAPIVANLAETLFPALQPVIRTLADSLREIAPDIQTFAQGLADAVSSPEVQQGLRDLINGLGDLLAAVGPKLPAIASAFGDIASAIGTVVGWAAKLIDILPSGLVEVTAKAAIAYAVLKKFGLLDLGKSLGKSFSAGLGAAFDSGDRKVASGGKRWARTLTGVLKGAGWAGVGLSIADELFSAKNLGISEKDLKQLGLSSDAGGIEVALNGIGLIGKEFGKIFTGDSDPIKFISRLTGSNLESLIFGDFNKGIDDAVGRWKTTIGQGLEGVRGVFDQGWGNIHQDTLGSWMQIGDAVGSGVANLRSIADIGFVGVREKALAGWTGLRDDALFSWAETTAAVSTGITALGVTVGAGIAGVAASALAGWAQMQAGTLGAWMGINGTVGAGVAQMQGTVGAGVAGMVGTVGSGLAQMQGAVAGGFGGMVGAVGSGLAQMQGANLAGWAGMVSTTQAKGAEVIAAARGVGSGIAGAFNGINLRGVGAALMDGLAAGIEARAAYAAAKARAAAAAVAAAAAGVLQVASPSKVFIRIGQFVMDGLIVGMENRQGAVVRAAEQVAASVGEAATRAAKTSPMQQAAQEMLTALTSGATFFEDFSFRGASALAKQFNDVLADQFYGQGGVFDANAIERFLRGVAGGAPLGGYGRAGVLDGIPPLYQASSAAPAAGGVSRVTTNSPVFHITEAHDARATAAAVDARWRSIVSRF
ncbi:phage tail family protein [Amycolatopsis thermophila]|uniref:Tape measure protein n=1 Tax=Amycolatopsis thermophila TaxID=206084 RepID=A0ABU0ENW6_9PSEU|nr:hypothetical protein [Amycolatopsis thermophila]MDQ0376492.1 hypothetical protein [Amycolatopsis thermophila]